MRSATITFIVASFVAQQAAAQGWTDASSFSCPGNIDNHCSFHQQSGYNWTSLQPGSFSSYGSNKFSGFQCSYSFGKRDALTKRDFQSKCIQGRLKDSPSMSGDLFSIDQMEISSSHDADIECHYGMPDGSTCKEVHSCSPSGTTFKNTQCGGAKSVTFKPGSNAPSGCSIGVHSVAFHCGSPSSPPSGPTYPKPPASTGTAPACYGRNCTTPARPSGYGSPPYGNGTSPSCYGPACSTPKPSYPAGGSPPGGSPSYPVSPPTYSSPSGSTLPQCPAVLPKCLQTWMFSCGCKDNSDASCFCQNERFVNNVYGCLSAWSTSDSDTSAAAGYLMGICAPHVPKNPAIVTGCPSTITPGPTPPAYAAATTSPVVTSPVITTPLETAPFAPCTTISYSSNTYTVPQVHFTSSTITMAGSTTCSVGLQGGTPTSVPAQPTSPVGTLPSVAGSTMGNNSGTGAATPPPSSSPVAPATGAAVQVHASVAGIALAAIAAFAAL